MSLVFACVTPHTPLLLPSVAKEKLALLDKTRNAMLELEKDIYVSQPDTIVILTPHGNGLPDALTVNMESRYVTNFEEFGDLVTKELWKPDSMLINRIREDFKSKHLPLTLTSSEALDYGVSIPLHYLAAHLPKVKIVPVMISSLDLKTHYSLGREIKDEIVSSTSRVAVIASADLSQRVSAESQGGLSARGTAYDEKMLEILKQHTHLSILDVDDAWVEEAQTCSSRVLATFFGLIEDINHKTDLLSYEKPFGIGYAVANIRLV